MPINSLTILFNEKIEFERNPLYWNDKETVINSATFLAIENPSTDVARYRAGDLDITSYALPPEQFAKLQKELPGEVFTTRTLATYSYELNNKKAPFDNVNVRKALNLSLDRNVITDKVLGQVKHQPMCYPNLHRRRSPHSTTCLFKRTNGTT